MLVRDKRNLKYLPYSESDHVVMRLSSLIDID